MSNAPTIEMAELHWLLQIIHSVDAGLVVVDRNYQIKVWNGFMEAHSGVLFKDIQQHSLFTAVADLPVDWLKQKIDTVFSLHTPNFTTWEQRPYIFPFPSYRPIAGSGTQWMFQNMTIIPLQGTTGERNHVCMIIYDVTDEVISKKAADAANAKLTHLSQTDRLTQLYNRGHWEQLLEREHARFMRYRSPSTLVMFDIDHFKRINDTYGHACGDDVIRAVAQMTLRGVRKTDLAGRYGGEEFGIVLVDTPLDQAAVFAERLRERIEKTVVRYGDTDIKFTVSLGLAQSSSSYPTKKAWIEAADAALYQSKQQGRNQVNCAVHPGQ